MKNSLISFLFIFFTSLVNAEISSVYTWEDLSVNVPESELRDFCVNPNDLNQIVVAGSKGVWRTYDRGKRWQLIYSVQGKRFVVSETIKEKESRGLFRFLKADDQDNVEFNRDFTSEVSRQIISEKSFEGATVVEMKEGKLYLGTFDGLFLSNDFGETWEEISFGVKRESKVILMIDIEEESGEISVGTLGGLFVSKKQGKKWKRLGQRLGENAVTDRIFLPEKRSALAILGKGVSVFDQKGKLLEQSHLGIGEQGDQIEALVYSLESETLFAATLLGLYCRPLNSGQWEVCGRETNFGQGLKDVEVDQGNIYVSGREGLFVSKDQGSSFEQIASGARFKNAGRIRLLDGVTYFMTPRGLFLGESSAPLELTSEKPFELEGLLWKQIQHEPSVQETQRQAMRFAQAHPEKIRAWQRGVKWRALLPKLQLGFDEERIRQNDLDSSISRDVTFDESLTLDQDVITASTFKGDRQIPVRTEKFDQTFQESVDFDTSRFRERETDFVVGVVWELGDFLYNPDEIGISKEARALAELRDDILKEVNQFYFRRRHLQLDQLMDEQDLEESELTPKEKRNLIEREFRIRLELEELTAQVDALTGGWFTKEIEQRKKSLVD